MVVLFKFLFYPILLTGFVFRISAQQLPLERMTDWTSPGAVHTLPVFDTIDVSQFGLKADGKTPNDAAVEQLLGSRQSFNTVFLFPPGEYLFHKPLVLHSGQVIKGYSAGQTKLLFDLGGKDNLITLNGKTSADTIWVNKAVQKDSSRVSVSNSAKLRAGDYVLLQSEDSALVTSSWAKFSTGQIFKVVQITPDNIELSKPIRKAISIIRQPRLIKLNLLENSGLECVSIIRMDQSSSQTSNVALDYSVNCWVKGIISKSCNFGHLVIQNSTQITVTGSHFSGAFDFGGNGKAYGVVLQFNTGDCLVDNNIFQNLRHSILLQAGANGNVISYNYSRDPYWTGTNLPANSAGDLVLHGNYPYLNLFEGNIVQNIVIDDSHGTNGPGNTFFRNRAELYGIFMSNNPASPGQLFIANEVTSTMPLTGLYWLSGGGHYEYGNNIRGTNVPANTNALSLETLFLVNRPAYFYSSSKDFGGIGLPNALNSHVNPAHKRYSAGEMTECEAQNLVPVVENVNASNEWLVSPNPTSGFLRLEFQGRSVSANIIVSDITGKRVLLTFVEKGNSLDLSGLRPGVYFINAQNETSSYTGKVILLRH